MKDKPEKPQRNSAKSARGKPFEKGNPGRLHGCRNKATIAAAVLIDGEAEALTRKCIELALQGDRIALRLAMERILPARRDRPVQFDLPEMKEVKDAADAIGALLAAAGTGDMTPMDAAEIAKLVDTYTRVLLARDLEQRVTELEAKAIQHSGKKRK